MDVLVVTDFPDIRLKAAIQSAHDGSVLVIPCEGGYLVRMYTELGELEPGERAGDRDISPDDLINAARRVLHPYTLDVKEVAWWSMYEIGQRLTDTFDDASTDDADPGAPHVFITGDACHTHSPKAGQGMTSTARWRSSSPLGRVRRGDPSTTRGSKRSSSGTSRSTHGSPPGWRPATNHR